jgi:hypothetical protein
MVKDGAEKAVAIIPVPDLLQENMSVLSDLA